MQLITRYSTRVHMAKRSVQTKVSQFHRQAGRCYWCGRGMIWHKPKRFEASPDNAVTVDHVYAIGHPKRTMFKKKGKPSPIVLACHQCNNERGNMDFEMYARICLDRYPGVVTDNSLHMKSLVVEPSTPSIKVVTNHGYKPKLKGFGKR